MSTKDTIYTPLNRLNIIFLLLMVYVHTRLGGMVYRTQWPQTIFYTCTKPGIANNFAHHKYHTQNVRDILPI